MIPPDSAKNQKNVYHIGGIPVEFPYQPYGSQLAFMGRVISTLDRAQREGHCHSLLESPTGTGKSLSLLCSALAWQRSYRSRNLSGNPAHLKPAPEAYTDPIGHGGGFVPESQPSASGNPEPAASATKTPSKKKTIPTIFYASRTHTQITQVIREYRKTTYRVPMAVLASRKHYCTNRHIHGKDNIDEECKLLLSNHEVGCPNFKNVHKVKGHQSLKKGGCYEVHDIEDLVKLGQEINGCSYFAARSMAEDAQLIFCPYSYVINPVIRKAMEVDIERAILVLDEAHNIEDMARDAGSVDAEEDVLHILQTELGQLTLVDPTIYQPLHEMMEGIISWMEQRKDTLGKREFQHYFSCWTGDKAMWELQEANISRQCFPILQECAVKAIRVVSDAEPDVAHLTGISATTLEGLFSSLTYFFSRNGAHIYDYQLALQRHIKRDARNAVVGWTHTLSLWCLNPAVVFKDIADLSLSVILTSGTLSPMNSFSSELGVQFGTCLEAPHVIDVESQLWAGVVSTGPGNYPLNASYKTADGYAFQDALGRSLEEICMIVPGGSLIFFPSYKLMEKLCNRWRETGQWSRLNARKPLFVEPRGGSQDDFEGVLNGYYDSIRGSKNPALGRKRRGKKLGLKNCDATECTGNSNKGAAFLAVCRGKVSEGIDFSDEKARVVIIVGIPFPNINDIQVAQKKKYNDTYKSSRNLLSGNEWYCHQAFRALNQAAGRCIRHRFDYGAVILLDERYREERNIMYISKWLKKSIRHYDSFDKSLEELRSFFRDVKKCLGMEADSISQNSDADVEIFSVPEQNKGFIIKKNKKVNKSHNCGQKLFSDHMMAVDSASRLCPSPICVENYDASFTQSKSEDDLDIQELRLPIGIYSHSSREYVDLDCSFQENLRCSGPLSIKVSHDDSDVTVIQETPVMDVSHNLAHPGSFCKDENCSSTITQDHPEFRDQLVLHTSSPTNSCVGASKSTYSLVTPEKNGTIGTNSLLAETESALNLSVNSHSQKRRKSIGSTLVNLVEVERFDAPCPCHSPSGHASFTSTSIISNDANKFKTPSFSNFPSGKISLNHVKNEGLQICCSFCRNTLGLPENNYLVRCSITSSSKIYLTTLLKGKCEATTENMPSIPVLISDTSSVDQQLYNRTQEGTAGQGIWCWEDGCVFNPIFCPFCRNPNNCLGSQIVAADASNIQLLNKILFYRDRLEIKGLGASEEKGITPAHVSDNGNCAAPISIEKFSYVPQQKKSDDWRTTKSKMRLPKRGASYGGLK